MAKSSAIAENYRIVDKNGNNIDEAREL